MKTKDMNKRIKLLKHKPTKVEQNIINALGFIADYAEKNKKLDFYKTFLMAIGLDLLLELMDIFLDDKKVQKLLKKMIAVGYKNWKC